MGQLVLSMEVCLHVHWNIWKTKPLILILQNFPFLLPAGATSHRASQLWVCPAGHAPLSDVAFWRIAIRYEMLTKKVLVFIEN